ncbi:MAG: hypothetical protein AAF434_18735 [Pseudomonadota bacterium]
MKEPEKIKLLFVCYGAGHVNMLVPIIEKVLADSRFSAMVLGLTTASSVLKRRGIPHIGFKDLLTQADAAAIERGESLAENLPENASVSRDETVAYLGLSYFDLETRLGADEATRVFAQKGRQAFLPISILERVFERVKPALLISTNSPRAERAAFYVAREHGIPSICIVGLFARHEIEWIREPQFASKICVISQGVKNFFERSGKNADEVLVTGNPALDRLSDPELDKRATEFKRDRGWGDKPVVLWASQPEPDRHPFTGDPGDPRLPRRVEQVLSEVAERRKDWILAIRYHPGESESRKTAPDNAYISGFEDDLATLLKSVSVVITMTSTVGIEGVMLGKPLITVDTSVFREDAPYSAMGLSSGVSDLAHLEAAIDRALSSTVASLEHGLSAPGMASQNVFATICHLCNVSVDV